MLAQGSLGSRQRYYVSDAPDNVNVKTPEHTARMLQYLGQSSSAKSDAIKIVALETKNINSYFR
jgi:predicted metalloendopeptidase